MRNNFITLLLILFNGLIFSKDNIDSVVYYTTPVTFTIPNSKYDVYITIINDGSDTLLTPSDIFVQGGIPNLASIFPIGIYSPNFLFLKPVDRPYLLADGFFEVSYYNFPELFVIPPKTQKVMIVNISHLTSNIVPGLWESTGYLRFAKKINLDSIVNNNYSNRTTEYLNSLIFADTVLTNSYSIDTLNSV